MPGPLTPRNQLHNSALPTSSFQTSPEGQQGQTGAFCKIPGHPEGEAWLEENPDIVHLLMPSEGAGVGLATLKLEEKRNSSFHQAPHTSTHISEALAGCQACPLREGL